MGVDLYSFCKDWRPVGRCLNKMVKWNLIPLSYKQAGNQRHLFSSLRGSLGIGHQLCW
jgi:hypothetical protein